MLIIIPQSGNLNLGKVTLFILTGEQGNICRPNRLTFSAPWCVIEDAYRLREWRATTNVNDATALAARPFDVRLGKFLRAIRWVRNECIKRGHK